MCNDTLPEDKIQCLFLNPLIYQCAMTRFGMDLLSIGGTYLSALGSQQGISISASTVSHCGSPVWKKTVMLRASMHRPVGGALWQLYYVYVKSADTSFVGNFTTA